MSIIGTYPKYCLKKTFKLRNLYLLIEQSLLVKVFSQGDNNSVINNFMLNKGVLLIDIIINYYFVNV